MFTAWFPFYITYDKTFGLALVYILLSHILSLAQSTLSVSLEALGIVSVCVGTETTSSRLSSLLVVMSGDIAGPVPA